MAKRRVVGNPKLAVAYLRASKKEQELSPEAQRESIENWAKVAGVTVVAWCVDAVCSVTSIADRPGLVGALAAIREHGAGLMVVAKRDRIARDVVVAAMIEQAASACGAQVVSAAGEGNGDGAMDKFVRQILDAVAELERANIRTRTKAALAVKRARGEKLGGELPYGYALAADGIRLEKNPIEQEVVETIRSLRERGCSLRGVVSELGARGITRRSGLPFGKTQVERICARLAVPAEGLKAA